jgi:hypothetical protein
MKPSFLLDEKTLQIIARNEYDIPSTHLSPLFFWNFKANSELLLPNKTKRRKVVCKSSIKFTGNV